MRDFPSTRAPLVLLAGALALAPALWPAPAEAETPPACDALKGKQRARAQKLLETRRPHACCDKPIARCLEQKRVCRLAYRLAQNICRRIARGQSSEQIVKALDRRAGCLAARDAKARFELGGYPSVGPAGALVTVVEYACARCPFCGLMTPALHEAVSKAPLAADVRLVFKPFPIRHHQHSKEANLGLMAAARLGKFWPFMKRLYGNFDAFSNDAQLGWAAEVGLDRAAFAKQLADPATRKALVASKKEGLRNKVDATPALFINGQRYRGEHRVDEVLDVLAEQVDRLKKQHYR